MYPNHTLESKDDVTSRISMNEFTMLPNVFLYNYLVLYKTLVDFVTPLIMWFFRRKDNMGNAKLFRNYPANAIF